MLLACLHACIAVAGELTLTMLMLPCAGPINQSSLLPTDTAPQAAMRRCHAIREPRSTGRPVKQGGCE